MTPGAPLEQVCMVYWEFKDAFFRVEHRPGPLLLQITSLKQAQLRGRQHMAAFPPEGVFREKRAFLFRESLGSARF